MTYSYLGTKVIEEFEDVEMLKYLYPRFGDHFPLFIDAGVITRIGVDNYRWNYNKSSVAQYFIYVSKKKRINMEWGMIEHTFKIKKGTLRRLASTNGNYYKLDNPEWKSKHFKKILEIIAQSNTE